MSKLRHDKRKDAELVRDADQAELDQARLFAGHKRPPRRAVRAAEAFLQKRDPWDEIKPRASQHADEPASVAARSPSEAPSGAVGDTARPPEGE